VGRGGRWEVGRGGGAGLRVISGVKRCGTCHQIGGGKSTCRVCDAAAGTEMYNRIVYHT
jgi:hypothetical protein